MSLDPEENEKLLPEPPSKKDAEAVLAHAEEVYATTPGLWQETKQKGDLFVDAILKAIAARG